MKSVTLKSTVATLLAALMTTQAGCVVSTPSDGSSASTQANVAATPSGEAFFRGIFFGEGAVADRLPEVWSPAARQSAFATAAQSGETRAQLATTLDELSAQLLASGASSSAVALTRAEASSLRAGTGPLSYDATSSTATSPYDAAYRTAIVARISAVDPAFLPGFQAALVSGDHVRISAALDQGTARLLDASAWLTANALPTGSTNPDPMGNAACAVFVIVAVVAVVVAVVLWRPVGSGEGVLGREMTVNMLAGRFAGGAI
jgi:SdpC family antimicrobial peptide